MTPEHNVFVKRENSLLSHVEWQKMFASEINMLPVVSEEKIVYTTTNNKLPKSQ
jgi:predicted transcriptional regulator